MVKLATARESRAYNLGGGGGEGAAARNRWEYINAGLYVFAAVLLVLGFVALLLPWAGWTRLGLVLTGIGLLCVLAVNVHDLLAHVAGVDYQLGFAMQDWQLALVELAVPTVQSVGTVLTLIGIIFFEIQRERGYRHGLSRHGLNLLIAGPVFWILGSIHNICQVYERASVHVQLLQKSVQIPFLLGSTLFLIGGIINRHHTSSHHIFHLLGRTWEWLGLIGSLLFLLGGVMNLLKVFKKQEMGGRGLEKLRGGAQDRLSMDREGKVPLILEHGGRRGKPAMPPPPPGSVDAVVSSAS